MKTKPTKTQQKMNYKEYRKKLIKEGFDSHGGEEGRVECFSKNNIVDIMLYYKGKEITKIKLSFGHSEDGYYEIENATIEQVDTFIAISKHAKYIGIEEAPAIRFKMVVLGTLKDFLENKEKEISNNTK